MSKCRNWNWVWPVIIFVLGLPAAAAQDALLLWNCHPVDPAQPWVNVRVTAVRGAPEIDYAMHVAGMTDQGMEELALVRQVIREEQPDGKVAFDGVSDGLSAELVIDRANAAAVEAPAHFHLYPGGRVQIDSELACDELNRVD
jgi:hypothetical protein